MSSGILNVQVWIPNDASDEDREAFERVLAKLLAGALARGERPEPAAIEEWSKLYWERRRGRVH